MGSVNKYLRDLRSTGILCTAITESAMTALRSNLPLDPRVHVVAVDPNGGDETGIEPAGGKGDVLPLDLSGVPAEVSAVAPTLQPFGALQGVVMSEESRTLNGDSGLSEAYRRVVQARLDALQDVASRRRTVSYGQRRGACFVGAVIDVDARAFAEADRSSVTLEGNVVSLIRAVIEELAASLSEDLRDSHRFRAAGSPWHAEILRNGARRLLHDFLDFESASVLDVLTAIASQLHEGAPCTGEMVWLGKDERAAGSAIRLRQPVRIAQENVALLRKLLVASGPGRAVACELVAGEGDLLAHSAVMHLCAGPGTPPSLTVRFFRGSRWELRVDATSLFSVVGGFVQLPPVFERERFEAACRRVFATVDSLAVDRLWEAARAVTDDPTGAVLVISEKAADHVRRIGAGFPCVPGEVDRTSIRDLSHIDGALVLSPDGMVRGVGVILDGPTCAAEKRERGSRYNSAVRFVASRKSERLVVLVVSSDGYVEVLEPH